MIKPGHPNARARPAKAACHRSPARHWKTSTAELGNDWQVIKGHHLEKEYSFQNFAEALAFTNKVGALAEEIFHHPDIFLTWGKVKIRIWTHKIDGLNEADFIFAAKADALQ